MSEHPTAPVGAFDTVTLLLAGIEGSAQNWEVDPAAMQASHSRYRDILEGAIEENGGYALQATGDTIQATFQSASQAAQAAIDAQLLLFTEEWPPSIGELQVGMAINTGSVQESAAGYSGPTLNRATALLSAGHGGQVLLSSATQELARDILSRLQPAGPPGVQLLDLGEHHLKELSRPEHIYQLVVPGLPAHFPPLRTLNSLPNNLPRQSTPLIGREKETADVAALLRRPDVGLVTLTGPAGTGKTRLSLQVGARMLDQYKDGVWFVELGNLTPDDYKLVLSAVAETLAVREVPGQEGAETLKEYLRDKEMLLVLDNFEQVTEAAPQVSSLLKAAPRLKALVTSRTALRVYGEREYHVPPLSMPDRKHLAKSSHSSLEQYTHYEAVRLFVDRAQAVKADFEITPDNAPDIVEICARLDALPLAIELAAARSRLFTPQALLGRLSDRLKILTGGAKDLPARQQTMRGAIEWSYDLLSEEEMLLYRRMAVFNSGATLEAVETVCSAGDRGWVMGDRGSLGADTYDPSPNTGSEATIDVLEGVQSLLDKSLLVEREGSDGEPRYWMLETIHEYAREKLRASGEDEALARAHALYFMRLAEEAEPGLVGERQAEWLDRLEDEHDNIRAALRWAGQPSGMRNVLSPAIPNSEFDIPYSREIGLRIAVAILQFWLTRGYFSEGKEQLEGLLSLLPPLPPFSPPDRDSVSAARYSLRSKAYNAVGALAYTQGDFAAARAALEQGLGLGREVGDKPSMARSFITLGSVADGRGDYPAAQAFYDQSLTLFRELGDKTGLSHVLGNLGNLALWQKDFPTARSRHEQSLALRRELGDKRGIATTLLNLGNVAFLQEAYSTAGSLYEQTLAQFREIEDKRGIAISLGNLGSVADQQGDYARARPLYEQSLALRRELGDKAGTAIVLDDLAGIACVEGDYLTAITLYKQSLPLFKELEDKRGIAVGLIGLGAIGIDSGATWSREGPDAMGPARTPSRSKSTRRPADRSSQSPNSVPVQSGARLLGASEAILERSGAALEAVDRTLYSHAVDSGRLQLGDEQFERARQEGRTMSTEAAIEYALQHAESIFAEAQAHEHAREEDQGSVDGERKVEELHIEVNQAKKAQQVEAITGTDYFIELQARAKALMLARRQQEAMSQS